MGKTSTYGRRGHCPPSADVMPPKPDEWQVEGLEQGVRWQFNVDLPPGAFMLTFGASNAPGEPITELSNGTLRDHWLTLYGATDPGVFYGQVIVRGPAPGYAYLGPWSSPKAFTVS